MIIASPTISCCIAIIICCSVLPGSPSLISAPSITCGSNGNQVTLQWTPPTNTGGQGVMITHYIITGQPQSASCSTGPCDMVDGTATTITGLQCGTSYMVSVRAVNCVGVSSSLQMSINLSPPGTYINYIVYSYSYTIIYSRCTIILVTLVWLIVLIMALLLLQLIGQ